MPRGCPSWLSSVCILCARSPHPVLSARSVASSADGVLGPPTLNGRAGTASSLSSSSSSSSSVPPTGCQGIPSRLKVFNFNLKINGDRAGTGISQRFVIGSFPWYVRGLLGRFPCQSLKHWDAERLSFETNLTTEALPPKNKPTPGT